MVVEKKDSGGSLDCTKCDQYYRFEPNGTYHYTLATLWPEMEETSDMYKNLFIPWWLKNQIFINSARLELGIITEEEYQKRIDEAKQSITEKCVKLGFPVVITGSTITVTKSSKPWWKFWQ